MEYHRKDLNSFPVIFFQTTPITIRETTMPTRQKEDRRGNPENLVPQFPKLAHALQGIDLPQDKEGLQRQAMENGADDEIMSLIEDMPERKYETMADVIAAAGEIQDTGKRAH
jgi:hypothetical protein